MSSTTPSAGAAAAMPLQPPTTLTLTAPEAPVAITTTQAPAMAPQVEATQVPVLDAKVDESGSSGPYKRTESEAPGVRSDDHLPRHSYCGQ